MACQMDVNLEGDGAWADLADKVAAGQVVHVDDESHLGVSALAGGMESGRTAVVLRVELPDGRTVIAQTSLRLFLMAAVALRARYGDE